MTRAWRCKLCGWLNSDSGKACASCEKNKPRAKRAKPQPSFRAWRCVVLSIDAGNKSGWAIWILGKLSASGEFRIYTDSGVAEVVRVVDSAKAHAALLGVPWVAFIEAAWGGKMGVGLGAAAGYWMFALRNAQLPRSRIGDVLPNVWRARVLPKGSTRLRREPVRRVEVDSARTYLVGRTPGDDEAPAILIGKWATQAGETGQLLPLNKRDTV